MAASLTVVAAVVARDAPDASRGRVMYLMQASMGICYGLGLLFIGFIGDMRGLRTAFTVGAVLTVVTFALLTRFLPSWRSDVDGVVAEEPATADLCPA